MLVSFVIPVWVFWVVGIPLALVVLGLAIVGGMFVWAFKDGLY